MSLYAIGDLHLHFQAELKARAQLTDRAWKKHEEKFRKNCAKLVRPSDTLLLLGDHSWGRNLEECAQDFEYIKALPGRKILLRGNHDMFWDAKKTESLNRQFAGELEFLQNNYYSYRDYALVGTKGFTFEGPFWLDSRGRIIDWDEKAEMHAKKLVERELERLRESFEAAKRDGFARFIMLLHYPPTNILEKESGFTRMAEEYGAEQVIYAHCHGESRFHDSIEGEFHGIRYSLTSGDFLRWMPMTVLADGDQGSRPQTARLFPQPLQRGKAQDQQ
ncbi:MAG: metallophosphoesterase [Lachnospiraceae bacterium]|nr:metallophosphoesterase [Lachnospiraceae bacterium]